jgi:hypothetical protein
VELSLNVYFLFYLDNGVISSFCAKTLQKALDGLIALFGQLGLNINSDKTKVMISNAGHIPIGMTTPVY